MRRKRTLAKKASYDSLGCEEGGIEDLQKRIGEVARGCWSKHFGRGGGGSARLTEAVS